MRASRRSFSERYKLHLYDYQRIDPANPRQLASDEVLPTPPHPNLSSSSVAFWFYAFGSFFIYSATRLMYDTEWDRYYHINYPASMEYFDVLSMYYAKKVMEFEGRYPRSWGEMFKNVNLTKAYRRWEEQKKEKATREGEEELINAIIATVVDADSIPEKLAGK